jgi:transcriptional regulator with GAF, ATPase, and Fis domain
VFQIDATGQQWSGTHGWCRRGIQKLAEDIHRRDMDAHTQWWFTQLQRMGYIRIDRTDRMPPEAATPSRLLRQSGTQSVCAMPLLADQTLLGFMTLDAVRAPRTWTDNDNRRFCCNPIRM